MEDYKITISQFVDNELPINKQKELFLFLSGNEEAQKVLADYMKMKNEIKSFYAEMDTEFDDTKVISAGLYSQKKIGKRCKMISYFSAAAVIVLVSLLLTNFLKNSLTSEKYQKLQTKYILLKENYSNVLNEKKRLVILTDKFIKETEKLKTKQVSTKHKLHHKNYSVKTKNKPPRNLSHKNQDTYFANIPTYKITKDDFLGQQIIGN